MGQWPRLVQIMKKKTGGRKSRWTVPSNKLNKKIVLGATFKNVKGKKFELILGLQANFSGALRRVKKQLLDLGPQNSLVQHNMCPKKIENHSTLVYTDT